MEPLIGYDQIHFNEMDWMERQKEERQKRIDTFGSPAGVLEALQVFEKFPQSEEDEKITFEAQIVLFFLKLKEFMETPFHASIFEDPEFQELFPGVKSILTKSENPKIDLALQIIQTKLKEVLQENKGRLMPYSDQDVHDLLEQTMGQEDMDKYRSIIEDLKDLIYDASR